MSKWISARPNMTSSSKTWVEATEKYGPQTDVKILPNGHYQIHNYHGGTPFPNPQDPNKGWKILANIFWAFQPSVYVNSPNNYGSVWGIDRYGNVNQTTLDVVYRWSDFNTDPGIPGSGDLRPGYLVHGMEYGRDSGAGALYLLASTLLC